VFAELIPFGAPDGVTAAGQPIGDLVAELESLGGGLSPFREIASRLHVLARRAPASG
jgi:hypothetical protein